MLSFLLSFPLCQYFFCVNVFCNFFFIATVELVFRFSFSGVDDFLFFCCRCFLPNGLWILIVSMLFPMSIFFPCVNILFPCKKSGCLRSQLCFWKVLSSQITLLSSQLLYSLPEHYSGQGWRKDRKRSSVLFPKLYSSLQKSTLRSASICAEKDRPSN